MNFSIKDNKIEFLGYNNDNEIKNNVILYFNKQYDKYNKIVVFDDYKVKDVAVLLTKNYCEIPREIKGGLFGIKVIFVNELELFETNRISVKRKE